MKEKPVVLNLPLTIRIARIAAIVFAVFISIFALDVFEEGVPFGQILLGLLMHLIPTLVILVILWIGWKWPLAGGILFVLVGCSYIVTAGNQALLTYLLIAAPPILIGLLFLVGHFSGKRTEISAS